MAPRPQPPGHRPTQHRWPVMVIPRQLDDQQLANYRTMHRSCELTPTQDQEQLEHAVLDLVPHIEWQARKLAEQDVTITNLRAELVSQQQETGRRLAEADGVITRLQAKLARLTDDPAADLPGAVRISPDEMVYVRSDGVDDGIPWARVGPGRDNQRSGFWKADLDVVGWMRGTPVEGTPAATAAAKAWSWPVDEPTWAPVDPDAVTRDEWLTAPPGVILRITSLLHDTAGATVRALSDGAWCWTDGAGNPRGNRDSLGDRAFPAAWINRAEENTP